MRTFRLQLRFLVPLFIILAATAYLAVPLMDKLTLRWFARDLDMRGNLVANALSDSVSESLQYARTRRIELLFQRALQDERLVAIGWCSEADEVGLDQYRGFVVSDIDARTNTLSFSNGKEVSAGEATGNVDEAAMRRIQIREAIRAHLEKEQTLFPQGVKVLTLFFIDEVAKYRQYDASGEVPGEYAKIFEEEYAAQLNELKTFLEPPSTSGGVLRRTSWRELVD
mgnify:CR=1 FL=1